MTKQKCKITYFLYYQTSMSGSVPDTPQGNEHEQQEDRSVQVKMIDHIKLNKIDCMLWSTRMLTIFFAIGYLIPIFG